MKLWMPPNSPCVRCNSAIRLDNENKLVCSGCGQLWTIGPEGCWETEWETELRTSHAATLQVLADAMSSDDPDADKTWEAVNAELKEITTCQHENAYNFVCVDRDPNNVELPSCYWRFDSYYWCPQCGALKFDDEDWQIPRGKP